MNEQIAWTRGRTWPPKPWSQVESFSFFLFSFFGKVVSGGFLTVLVFTATFFSKYKHASLGLAFVLVCPNVGFCIGRLSACFRYGIMTLHEPIQHALPHTDSHVNNGTLHEPIHHAIPHTDSHVNNGTLHESIHRALPRTFASEHAL